VTDTVPTPTIKDIYPRSLKYLTYYLQGLVRGRLWLQVLVGMVLGRRIRQRLAERVFRRVFFAALLSLGAYIIATALGGI